MNTLTVLSGADVSGSCYLLEINGVRMLFDCGTKPNSKYSDNVEIPDPQGVDAIFISHAHMDHMGAVAYVASVCKNAVIYVTPMTAEFIKYQLSSTIAGYIGANTEELKYHNQLLCSFIFNRIKTVNYEEKCRFTAQNGTVCDFSFFNAGHMPGAAMVYLRVKNFSFLYTGDFNTRETVLADAYELPVGKLPVNVMLLCGLHANDPTREYRNSIYDMLLRKFKKAFDRNSKIIIPAYQLTKGLEILSMIVSMTDKGDIPRCTVYLDDSLWMLAHSFESREPSFRLPSFVKRLAEAHCANAAEKGIIITDKPGTVMKYGGYTEIKPDFSLHPDYPGLVELINRLSPEAVYTVHVGNLAGRPELAQDDGITVPTEIHYTENNVTYQLN